VGEQDGQLATIIRHETTKMSWRGVKKELENKSTVMKPTQFILDMAEKAAAIPADSGKMAQIVPLCGILFQSIHPIFLEVKRSRIQPDRAASEVRDRDRVYF
jgi:hypothetical protein